MPLAPQTQTLPICRATSAACDETPPREVRIQSPAIMPRKSSGEVSTRASTTFSPFFERATASSALKTTWPDAAPGPAAKPLPIFFPSLADCRSKMGASRCASESAGTRLTASSLEISFSPTISTAMRTAAWPVRFPLRVCRSEEHTSELQSLTNLVCRLLLEKKKNITTKQGIAGDDKEMASLGTPLLSTLCRSLASKSTAYFCTFYVPLRHVYSAL